VFYAWLSLPGGSPRDVTLKSTLKNLLDAPAIESVVYASNGATCADAAHLSAEIRTSKA
jgi:hypothetical protein